MKKLFMLLVALILQNTILSGDCKSYCMNKMIGESLDYRKSNHAQISLENKKIFDDNYEFFNKLTSEISRWDTLDFDNVVGECLNYNNVQSAINLIENHISVVRLIAVDKKGGSLTCRIECVPFLFLSGTIAANGNKIIKNNLCEKMRFIDSYGFSSSNDQSYSHSERALVLALSIYGDYQLSKFVKTNTVDLCIQVRNQNRMCVNCANFIYGKDIYFIKPINSKGRFVIHDYYKEYNKCRTILELKQFIKKYNIQIGISSIKEEIDKMSNDVIKILFKEIKPKTISDLINCNVLLLETMNSGKISEVVKIYIEIIM